MNWLAYPLQWYLTLFAIGIIFTPLAKKLFSTFSDEGYSFARVIGIILISYSAFVLGVTKMLSFSWIGLLLIALIWAVVNGRLRERVTITRQMVISELLFIASFFALVWIRGQESSIHGLEKFMDYGFMQSILKSQYFPPRDMWYTPEPINYYYFGHLSGAVLIRLAQVPSQIGYNLILATIFALAITQTYSLVYRFITHASSELRHSISAVKTTLFAFVGTLLLNLGGNLHTIYLFTKGYPNDHPIPFWQILSSFNPTAYWYPNATRFIPYTIHEFPAYSYVVADLHGHVFDIPFVLLTVAVLFTFYTNAKASNLHLRFSNRAQILNTVCGMRYAILFGFLTAVHYMTNAFDGPIYLLLAAGIIYLKLRNIKQAAILGGVMLLSFVAFSLPFSVFFKPFATGIGVNCAHPALLSIKKIGPFLFEPGNCQTSPLWMMALLWGQFWIVTGILAWCIHTSKRLLKTDRFILSLLLFSVVLVWIPEFIYAKDIYPLHFRANTMFKLGYQAFILGSLGIGFTLYRITSLRHSVVNSVIRIITCLCLFFILIYALMPFTSFYGTLRKQPDLNGISWLERDHPDMAEVVDYLNRHVAKQSVILEAQGDSYTDYNVISSYTGNPTVAGWWVHEWLWRGSSEVVQQRIPDIVNLYESSDVELTRQLLKKYKIDYVVVTGLEREKYPKLLEQKFLQTGRKVLNTKHGFGALYSVNP